MPTGTDFNYTYFLKSKIEISVAIISKQFYAYIHSSYYHILYELTVRFTLNSIVIWLKKVSVQIWVSIILLYLIICGLNL